MLSKPHGGFHGSHIGLTANHSCIPSWQTKTVHLTNYFNCIHDIVLLLCSWNYIIGSGDFNFEDKTDLLVNVTYLHEDHLHHLKDKGQTDS
jgi:hypothetical protein